MLTVMLRRRSSLGEESSNGDFLSREIFHQRIYSILFNSPMAVAKCGAKGLQSSDVPGELENPEDPENPEDLGGLGNVLQGVLGGQEVEENRDEKGQDAH